MMRSHRLNRTKQVAMARPPGGERPDAAPSGGPYSKVLRYRTLIALAVWENEGGAI